MFQWTTAEGRLIKAKPPGDSSYLSCLLRIIVADDKQEGSLLSKDWSVSEMVAWLPGEI